MDAETTSTAVSSAKPLEGKVGLVCGVANKRSIAWGVAKAWAEAGAQLIFSYQGERLEKNVRELAAELNENPIVIPCDVSNDVEIDAFFAAVRERYARVDMLLHSIAYAPKEALEGNFLDTSREAFATAHDVSAYSLIALSRGAAPLMTDGGLIISMTYYGSVKVIPNYNVMGVAKASLEATTRYLAWSLGEKKIRVNSISAGPVKTLAAMGVSGISKMIKTYEAYAPLRTSCTPDDIGATAVFLASPGAACITGQVIYVDGGYEIMGMYDEV